MLLEAVAHIKAMEVMDHRIQVLLLQLLSAVRLNPFESNSNEFSYLLTPAIFSGHGSSHHGGDHNDLDAGTLVSAIGSGDSDHGHGHQGLDTATIVGATLSSDSGSHHGSGHSSYGGLDAATIVGATQGGKQMEKNPTSNEQQNYIY